MAKYRKLPVVIEAHRWTGNGSHPGDNAMGECADGMLRPKFEGAVVGHYRVDGHRPAETARPCEHCGGQLREHGWIATLEGGHIVCPGDWIITGVKKEHYPCKPDIFARTYEPVPERAPPAPGARPEYVIEHITDLCAVPPEHLDECIESLHMAIVQVRLIRAVMVADGAPVPAIRTMLPCIVYVADGIAKSTVRMGDQDFVISKDKTP